MEASDGKCTHFGDLNLRTRIKRLAHKIICFSKSITMHDIVIGLFIDMSSES